MQSESLEEGLQSVTRRRLLQAAALSATPPIAAIMSLSSGLSWAKSPDGIYLISGDRPLWNIDTGRFEGSPTVGIDELAGKSVLTLQGARYASTTLSADFRAVIQRRGDDWSVDLEHTTGGVWSLNLLRWLESGEAVLSRNVIPGRVLELAGGEVIEFGSGPVAISPDLALSFVSSTGNSMRIAGIEGHARQLEFTASRTPLVLRESNAYTRVTRIKAGKPSLVNTSELLASKLELDSKGLNVWSWITELGDGTEGKVCATSVAFEGNCAATTSLPSNPAGSTAVLQLISPVVSAARSGASHEWSVSAEVAPGQEALAQGNAVLTWHSPARYAAVNETPGIYSSWMVADDFYIALGDDIFPIQLAPPQASQLNLVFASSDPSVASPVVAPPPSCGYFDMGLGRGELCLDNMTANVFRRDDQLNLRFKFRNAKLVFKFFRCILKPIDPALPTMMKVELPPQAIAEQAFPEPDRCTSGTIAVWLSRFLNIGDPPDYPQACIIPHGRAEARIVDGSRLVYSLFANNQARQLEFTLANLLRWPSFQLVLNPRACSDEDKVKMALYGSEQRWYDNYGKGIDIDKPDEWETAIEIVHDLLVSPTEREKFFPLEVHEPPYSGFREVWQAQLGIADIGPHYPSTIAPDRRPKFRALYSSASSNAHINDPFEKIPLDFKHRRELVELSSLYGAIAIPGSSDINGLIGVRAPSAIEVEKMHLDQVQCYPHPDKHVPCDSSEIGIYVPRPLTAKLFLLSSTGASIESHGLWGPPSFRSRPDPFPDPKSLSKPKAETLGMEVWDQIATQGFSHRSCVGDKIFSLPTGHRISWITLSERKIRRNKYGQIVAATLMREFITLSMPEKSYPAVGQPDGGRGWPFSKIEFSIKQTPDLVPPESLPDDLVLDPKCPGDAFWVCIDKNNPHPYLFPFSGTSGEYSCSGSLPMVVVSNECAHNPEKLVKAINFYNQKPPTLAHPSGVKWRDRRSLTLNGSKVEYALKNVNAANGRLPIETAFPTSEMIVEVEPLASLASGTPDSRGVLFNSSTLEAANQIACYPKLSFSMVRISAIERLVQSGDPVQTAIGFDATYLEHGFSPAENSGEIFGVVFARKRIYDLFEGTAKAVYPEIRLNFSGRGEKSAAIGQPNLTVVGLSRVSSLVGGEASSERGIAPVLYGSIKQVAVDALTPATTPLDHFRKGTLDPKMFFPPDAKLLGLIPFRDVISLCSAFDGAPKLDESSILDLPETSDIVSAMRAMAMTGQKIVDDAKKLVKNGLPGSAWFDMLRQLIAELEDHLKVLRDALDKPDLEGAKQNIPAVADTLRKLDRHLSAAKSDPANLISKEIKDGLNALLGQITAGLGGQLKDGLKAYREAFDSAVKRLTEKWRGEMSAQITAQINMLEEDVKAYCDALVGQWIIPELEALSAEAKQLSKHLQTRGEELQTSTFMSLIRENLLRLEVLSDALTTYARWISDGQNIRNCGEKLHDIIRNSLHFPEGVSGKKFSVALDNLDNAIAGIASQTDRQRLEGARQRISSSLNRVRMLGDIATKYNNRPQLLGEWFALATAAFKDFIAGCGEIWSLARDVLREKAAEGTLDRVVYADWKRLNENIGALLKQLDEDGVGTLFGKGCWGRIRDVIETCYPVGIAIAASPGSVDPLAAIRDDINNAINAKPSTVVFPTWPAFDPNDVDGFVRRWNQAVSDTEAEFQKWLSYGEKLRILGQRVALAIIPAVPANALPGNVIEIMKSSKEALFAAARTAIQQFSSASAKSIKALLNATPWFSGTIKDHLQALEDAFIDLGGSSASPSDYWKLLNEHAKSTAPSTKPRLAWSLTLVAEDMEQFLHHPDLGALVDIQKLLQDALASFLPTRQKLTYSLNAPLQAVSVFKPKPDTKLKLDIKLEVDLLRPGNTTSVASGKLGSFDIVVPQFVTLEFAGAEFSSANGKSDLQVQLTSVIPAEAFKFIEELAKKLNPKTGPFLEVRADGITAGYRLPIPTMDVVAFTIADLSIIAALNIPFSGAASTIAFQVSEPARPFRIIAGVYGGAGYLKMTVQGDGIVELDASFRYGGMVTKNYEVLKAAGECAIGVRYLQDGRGGALTAFFLIAGQASIVGVDVGSVGLRVDCTHGGGGQVTGEATFWFSIGMGWFSVDFKVPVKTRLNSESGRALRNQKTSGMQFGEVINFQDERVEAFKHPLLTERGWSEYLDAFEQEGAPWVASKMGS
jgi:hypothetical protein